MKKLIRKILKEEVDKDYEGLVDGDNYILTVNYQLLLFIIKNNGNIRPSLKQLGLSDGELITKLFLLLSFNSKEKILEAYEKRDTSIIYSGPFYNAKVEFYGEIYEDEEYVEEDCEYCDGTGYENQDCYPCGGSGEIEDDDGEYVTCSDCGGSGEEEDDCGYCGGSGYQEYLEDVEKIDSFTVMVFSKEPIIIDELVDKHISTVSKLGMVKGKYKFMDTKSEPKNMGGVYEEEEKIDYVYDSHIVVRGEDLTDYV
jgi:hypothetical protein